MGAESRPQAGVGDSDGGGLAGENRGRARNRGNVCGSRN